MMTSVQKKAIALTLLEEHPEWYPDHYGREHLNNSNLCRFKNENGEDVLISVKCLRDGSTKPCIGFYFQSATKMTHLDGLKNDLKLPDGFQLNDDSMSDKEKGWVEFCRKEDCSEEKMYKEIVEPGDRKEEWKKLFEVLRQWATDKIGGESHYVQEKGWEPKWGNEQGVQNNINNNHQQGIATMSNQTLTEEIKQLLESNYQVILTGAPGTGKTYTAKEVAKEMVGAKTSEDATEEQKKEAKKIEEDRIEFVQFHPGYDYSDFVIGMKPMLVSEEGKEVFANEDGTLYTTDNGMKDGKQTSFSGKTDVSFLWKDGIFKKFADRAKGDPDHNYVFLIDEINRADLSRVFGELFSLLEEDYRYPNENGTGIALPNGENFVIPKNLYIIGTMNDIDRSVESMDFALRRRFAWREVSAKESECIIDNTIVDADAGARLKKAMNALNLKIADPDFRLGTEYQLGGAIFKKYAKYNGQGDAFEKLWKNHIEIILKEYLRGRRTRSQDFETLKGIYDEAVNIAQQSNGAQQSPAVQ